MDQPSGLKNMALAAAGALPFVSRGSSLPDRTVTITDLAIDPANVSEYAAVTGLRFGDTVPLTYPFALSIGRSSTVSVRSGSESSRGTNGSAPAAARSRFLNPDGWLI